MSPRTGTHLQLVRGADGTRDKPLSCEVQTFTFQIEHPPRSEAPDEIRSIAAWAKAWDLEHTGLRSAVERAEIPTAKIGRAICVRRSDLLSLVEKLAIGPKAKPAKDSISDYESLIAEARERRR